jgi:hypothetical protein
MKKTIKVFQIFLAMMLAVILAVPSITGLAAQPQLDLGLSSTFAVMGASTITNTGPTTVTGSAGGDIGLYPGTSITGLASITMSGILHQTDAAAMAAQTDLTNVYNTVALITPTANIDAQDIGGLTLLPGVYRSASSIGITGVLTLDAQGDPEAVFVFQAGSTLITAAGSRVELINGARPSRIYWQVGSSATLGVGSHLAGHVFALASITANNGATVQGQLLALNGAVTLDTNTITNSFDYRVISAEFINPYFGQNAPIIIKAESRPDKIQIYKLSDDTTNTYTRSIGSQVVSIQGFDINNNKVDTFSSNLAYEIWKINVKLGEGNYVIRAKYNNIWNTILESKSFSLIYNVKVPFTFTADKTAVVRGTNLVFTAVTTINISKIQFVLPDGSTMTYADSYADFVDNAAAGTRTWSVSKTINLPSNDYTWILRTRTPITSFSDTGLSVDFTVVPH